MNNEEKLMTQNLENSEKIEKEEQISDWKKEGFESEENQKHYVNFLEKMKLGRILTVSTRQKLLPFSNKKLDSSEFQEACLTAIKINLESNKFQVAEEMKELLPISQEKLNSPEIQEASYKIILENLRKGGISKAKEIQKTFPTSQGKLGEASCSAIINLIQMDQVKTALEIKDLWNGISDQKIFEAMKNEILGYGFQNYGDLSEIEIRDLMGDQISSDELNSNLTYMENLVNYVIEQNEVEIAENPEEKEKELEELDDEEKAKKLFENLQKLKNSTWDLEGERSDIAKEFFDGAEKFGYKKMFDFIGQHNRHDALFAFDKIMAMQEKSGLGEDDFYGKILYQVAKDSSVDENNRDSYAKLNDIAQKFEDKNINDLITEIKDLDISSVQVLLEKMKDENGEHNPFQNWKILQKVADFDKILAHREILEKIKNLPKKHQEFYEKLIFHPNINTSAIIQMIEDPEGFLDRDDTHSNDELHDLSKAGNFYKFDYSNLSAREIIDMMIEGELDKIQKIPEFEMIYKIPVNENLQNLSVRELLRKALGIRGKNAEAKRPKKIFQEVKDLVEKYNQEKETDFKLDKEFIDNSDFEIPEELEKEIQDILFNEESGFATKEIRFASLAKSDPDGIIAGTDTASCDAWGAGKKNTYVFNPNIGQIVIQEKKGDSWKTLSQATATLDYKIEKNVGGVLGEIRSNSGDISEVLSDKILENKKKVFSLDSIEGNTDDFLKGIWENGVFALTKEMSKNENIDTESFVQGSYQGMVLGKSVENNYLPTAIMAYSDNTKSQTNLVDKVSKKIFGEILKEVDKRELREDLPKGISELSSEDAMKTAYLEGKAYKDNNSLQEFLFTQANTLAGQDYESTRSPKMSFKYENSDGKMEGYIIAYEANFDNENIEEIPALYINDLAALPEAKMAGGKLIKTFVDEYFKNYIDKGEMIPIVTHARDKTSYQIILNQMNKIAEKNNIKFEMKEINSYHEGNDEMHELVIYPKK